MELGVFTSLLLGIAIIIGLIRGGEMDGCLGTILVSGLVIFLILCLMMTLLIGIGGL